jgi:hypothetical protein
MSDIEEALMLKGIAEWHAEKRELIARTTAKKRDRSGRIINTPSDLLARRMFPLGTTGLRRYRAANNLCSMCAGPKVGERANCESCRQQMAFKRRPRGCRWGL